MTLADAAEGRVPANRAAARRGELRMSTFRGPWTDAGFLLADWEVRPRHGTLLRRSDPTATPVQLEPRVMAVLVCLARHAGEVVTRDEFIADVWVGRVVSDEALSRCISLLRQALADDSREPRFIRTVAKVGYALLQPPAPLGATEPLDTLPSPRPEELREAVQPRRARIRRDFIAVLV